MSTETYHVDGMSCGHCVQAVTSELEKIAGVRSVEVALDDGTVRVTADPPIDESTIAAAIGEAGYAMRPRP